MKPRIRTGFDEQTALPFESVTDELSESVYDLVGAILNPCQRKLALTDQSENWFHERISTENMISIRESACR